MPLKKTRQPTPVFLPGESHGERRLEDYSPWGRKELDTTEHACIITSITFQLLKSGLRVAHRTFLQAALCVWGWGADCKYDDQSDGLFLRVSPPGGCWGVLSAPRASALVCGRI